MSLASNNVAKVRSPRRDRRDRRWRRHVRGIDTSEGSGPLLGPTEGRLGANGPFGADSISPTPRAVLSDV
jgi:hypothetical protein